MRGFWKRTRPLLLASGPVALGLAAFRFLLSWIDDSVPFWIVRTLVASSAGIATTAVSLFLGQRWMSAKRDPPTLAGVIVQHTRVLRARQQNRAVIEFRAWASPILQSIQAYGARAELGDLVREACEILGDRATVAGVLVDELGWNVFADGDAESAVANIQEGIRILNDLITHSLDGDQDRHLYVDLRAKAWRHLAGIKAVQGQFGSAHRALEAAQRDAQNLIPPFRAIALAKLDFANGFIVSLQIAAQLAPGTQVAACGTHAHALRDAVQRCRSAAVIFRATRNLEWEGRVLRLLPELLGHYEREPAVREAKAQAEAIEQQLARSINYRMLDSQR